MSRFASTARWGVAMFAVALMGSTTLTAADEPKILSPDHTPGKSATEGLIVLGDAGLQQVVVVDPKARKLILYAISGTSTRPVVVRDLDADLVAGADVLPALDLPETDVPGAELDDVPRPADAVRVGYSRDAVTDTSGTWTVDYIARGGLAQIYERIRASLGHWRLVSERVSTTSRVAGAMQYESGPRRLTVLVRAYQPGYQQVRFELRVP